MSRARAIVCFAIVFSVLGGCTPRAREKGRARIAERMSAVDNRGASAPAANASAPQAEKTTAAEAYFHKDTDADKDEFGGMKGGLPMLLFIGLLAAAVGAL